MTKQRLADIETRLDELNDELDVPEISDYRIEAISLEIDSYIAELIRDYEVVYGFSK